MSRWVYAGTCSQGYYGGFRFYATLANDDLWMQDEGPRVGFIARCAPNGRAILTKPAMYVRLPVLVDAVQSGDFEDVSDYDDDYFELPSLAAFVDDLGSLLAQGRQEFGADLGGK